jgi:hypothetical protein
LLVDCTLVAEAKDCDFVSGQYRPSKYLCKDFATRDEAGFRSSLTRSETISNGGAGWSRGNENKTLLELSEIARTSIGGLTTISDGNGTLEIETGDLLLGASEGLR